MTWVTTAALLIVLATSAGVGPTARPPEPPPSPGRGSTQGQLLVATQTRVVELAVDEQGSWVPSVPTLAIVPRSVDDLWLLAAAVASPTATAWLWRRAPGTALSRNALKVAARDLSELPLPVDAVLWAAAADAFRAYASAPSAAAFEDYVVAAAGAYDAPDDLVAWWRDRVEPVIDSTRDVEVPLV